LTHVKLRIDPDPSGIAVAMIIWSGFLTSIAIANVFWRPAPLYQNDAA
jgi:hypothetical protein